MRSLRATGAGERGAALVMVVGLVVLMTALVVGVQYEIGRGIAWVRTVQDNGEARRMAEVGLNAAMMLLKYDYEEDTRNNRKVDYYFAVNVPDDPVAAMEMLANASEFWSLFVPGQGASQMLASLGIGGNLIPIADVGAFEISIEDESAKYNVHRLFKPAGTKIDDVEARAAIGGISYLLGDDHLARRIVAALIDWMDRDDQLVDPTGAESFQYQSLDAPYMTRNGPIQSIEELRAIAGVDEDVYQSLVSGVTVWPNDLRVFSQYKINVNTASEDGLAFLHRDIDTPTIDAILSGRDPDPYERMSDFTEILKQEGMIELYDDRDPKTSEEIAARQIVGFRSRAFKIRSTGYTDAGQATLEAVVDRNPDTGKMRVLYRRWLTLVEPS
ncbi:MAG: general secretion pathway protein GspK [Candidatus Dadabacteria bacterium]|nr:MAG: general secretion pathway protein GspK [Candidatus Dadabacteria bacterium]